MIKWNESKNERNENWENRRNRVCLCVCVENDQVRKTFPFPFLDLFLRFLVFLFGKFFSHCWCFSYDYPILSIWNNFFFISIHNDDDNIDWWWFKMKNFSVYFYSVFLSFIIIYWPHTSHHSCSYFENLKIFNCHATEAENDYQPFAVSSSFIWFSNVKCELIFHHHHLFCFRFPWRPLLLPSI